MDSKTVFSIISAVVSILSLLGFGTVMTMFWKDKHDKKVKQTDALDAANREAEDRHMVELIRSTLKEELAPYKKSVEQFREDIKWIKTGNQALCRSALQEMAYKAEKDGYSSEDDKQRWNKLYTAYHNLGENGAMDARNDWYLTLPSTKPKQIRQRSTEIKK